MAKLLLVEDDKNLREIYATRLGAEGYDITSSGDGEEALAVAIKEKPDLIISDVMMPKISGFDMLDILRSTPETRDIKVIMMTALSSEDQRQRGESLGANRYLVKSQVGIEDVVRTVHEVLGDAPATANANTQATTQIQQDQPPVPPSEPLSSIPRPTPAPSPTVAQPAPSLAPFPSHLATPTPTLEQPQVQTSNDTAAPASPEPVQDQVAEFTPTNDAAETGGLLSTSAPDDQPTLPPLEAQVPDMPLPAPSIEQPQPESTIPPAPLSEQPPADAIPPVITSPDAVETPSLEAEPPIPTFVAPAPFPAPNPNTFAPQPSAPTTPVSVPLPQPTAPFSTPRPGGISNRTIQPILDNNPAVPVADQLNAELDSLNTVAPPASTGIQNNPVTNFDQTAPSGPTLPVEPQTPAAAATGASAPVSATPLGTDSVVTDTPTMPANVNAINQPATEQPIQQVVNSGLNFEETPINPATPPEQQ